MRIGDRLPTIASKEVHMYRYPALSRKYLKRTEKLIFSKLRNCGKCRSVCHKSFVVDSDGSALIFGSPGSGSELGM
jgi:hypothetical protein